MKKRKYTSVSIPIKLAEKIKKEISETGFKSTADYVTFILREVLSDRKKISKKGYEEKIKNKLRALGYIK